MASRDPIRTVDSPADDGVVEAGLDAGAPLEDKAAARDALTALRNTVKLGGAMLFTMGIGLAVRFPLRRYLGPEVMGPLNFAESFAAMFFVALGLGVDTYIRKEVPIRPAHASDFFGSILAVRLAGAAVLFAAMALVLEATGRPPEVRLLCYAFGAAQLLVITNQSFAALLHSTGTVDGLSLVTMASKAVWGAGIVYTLVARRPLVGIALSLVVAEALKAVVCYRLARKHLSLKLHFQLTPLKVAILGSLPFFLNGVAHTIYNKLDISLLDTVGSDLEVGWYSAASDLATATTMIITPFIGSVLMPLFARSAARSEHEYTQMMRRTLELILILAIPCTLALSVGAELWISLAYGPQFAPAVRALQILAPLFVLTYVAMLSAVALNLEDRGWTVTFISLGGLLVNPLLNWLLIGPSMRAFGAAGGGMGCAIAQLGTEILVTVALLWAIGKRAFDRRTLTMVGKTLLVCGAVVSIDRLFLPLGHLRIALDALAYCALIVVVRAIHLRETVDFIRTAFRRRREA